MQNFLTAKNKGLVRWLIRLRLWSRRLRLPRRLAYLLVAVAVVSGLGTFATMTKTSPFGEGAQAVLLFLYLDAILLLILSAIIIVRIVSVWVERRRGLAGSRLHSRLVVMFSVVAVTPAILVAIFSGFYLNFGIQDWFSERVRTAVEESLIVAQAYLHEHRQTIRADAFGMANDLNRDAAILVRRPQEFNKFMSNQAELRSLSEAVVIDSNGQVLARSALSFTLEFEPMPRAVVDQADKGDVVVLSGEGDSRIRATVKLNRFVGAYLVVARFVDPVALERIDRTARAVAEYQSAERKREGFQITFVMIFVVVALLLLLAAVWVGLNVATQLARPISALIGAAERVRKGDLTARVSTSSSPDEIGGLSRAFNRMTGQLEGQQQGLVDANRQLDERRQFTETVLAGVSAGVVGLDSSGRIHLPNRSASLLLGVDLGEFLGRLLTEFMPEIADILDAASRRNDRLQQAEIRFSRGGDTRILMVRVGTEQQGENIIGFVVTFDDVTDLLSAQRTAAWADVAQRIAHEIKNPLTPIQLSAERLRRKYLTQIEVDSETFEACIETITRQVGNIGRMVDEFSSFARMPQPSMKEENLCECIRRSVFLERNRQLGVTVELSLPDADIMFCCDQRQIDRVFTNILKNSMESIFIKINSQSEESYLGLIEITASGGGGSPVIVTIEDNGIGLPPGDRDRLLEPYVTTRENGTGLGLAIVKKIMEDHCGILLLEDRLGGGACVSMVFTTSDNSDACKGDVLVGHDEGAATSDAIADGIQVGKNTHGR